MCVEINSVVLGGNLTKEPALKEIAGGRKVASFTVASNRTFVINGEKKKETSFIDVDVWGPAADNCGKYLVKGSPVVVTGRLKQDQWQNENGEKRSRLKVIAANVQFLPTGKPAEVGATSGAASAGAEAPDGWSE